MPEDAQNAETPLAEALEMAQRALELLDHAVGRAARLPVRERERLREHLMPPRNHLRGSVDSLRRKIELEELRRSAPRAG